MEAAPTRPARHVRHGTKAIPIHRLAYPLQAQAVVRAQRVNLRAVVGQGLFMASPGGLVYAALSQALSTDSKCPVCPPPPQLPFRDEQTGVPVCSSGANSPPGSP